MKLTYIGTIKKAKRLKKDLSSINVILRFLDLIPLLIEGNIIEYYVKPLIGEGLIKVSHDNLFIADVDILRIDLDRIGVSKYLDIDRYGISFDLVIIPGLLHLSRSIVLDKEPLISKPNRASSLIHYLKALVRYYIEKNVKYVVFTEPTLNEIINYTSLRYGYKREFIVEAYDYIADEAMYSILYLSGRVSPIAIEIASLIPSINAIGIDIDSAPKNIYVIHNCVSKELCNLEKELVLGILDPKNDDIVSISLMLKDLVQKLKHITMITLDTVFGNAYSMGLDIESLKNAIHKLKRIVSQIGL